ncbi:uncharacterized protein LOC111398667 isoform X6 [Olea europaea var. sylvestris]|uniref:uncharacterized protein LOC111398667 isoform X6 n=1 Tax=Olea europaea var. sylvestris TaxID=158386 RepID=UPI000C1D80A6|nr:uncharacterized protein LOC111398667 isoform X6 [Olea europaea var. sylvestris]
MSSRSRFNPAENSYTLSFSIFFLHRTLLSPQLYSSSLLRSRSYQSEFPALQSTKWRVVVLLMMHRRLLSDAYNGGWCSYWQRSFCNDHGCRAVQSLLYLKFTDEEAFTCIERELGLPFNSVYSSISASPIATTTLGELYKAQLKYFG